LPKFISAFFWVLIITVLIFAKKSQISKNICEANLKKKIKLFFHYGIIKKRSRDRINEQQDMRPSLINIMTELIHNS
jgi:hypothetical protein